MTWRRQSGINASSESDCVHYCRKHNASVAASKCSVKICSFTDNRSCQNTSSSFRFLPSRLRQLTIVWCVWRTHAEASVDPYTAAAVARLITAPDNFITSRMCCISCTCTDFLSGDEATTRSRMSGASVVVWFGTGIFSRWRQPCRRRAAVFTLCSMWYELSLN